MLQLVRIQLVISALGVAILNSGNILAGETWDGGGSDNNWTTEANWNPNCPICLDSIPDNDGTADIRMAGSMRLTPRVDVDWDIDSLTFNNTAGAFSISGDPGVSLGIGAGGIRNNDAQLQLLLLPIALNASQTWNAAAGPLSIGNTVVGHFLTPRTLTLDGANNIQIAGAITNRTELNKTGAGTLTFNGLNTNTYTGTTTVSAGTLALGRSGGPNRSIPGNLVIGDGAGGAGADVVRLDSADQITEAAGRIVTVNSSGLLNLNGFNETLANLAINGGSLSGAGSLTVNEALTFTGGGSISTAMLSAPASPVVVNSGLLNISSAGRINNTSGRIGSIAGSNGAVSINGASSAWTNSQDLYIGGAGTGTLNVTSGGQVASTLSYIGDQIGSVGDVTIDAANSKWTVSLPPTWEGPVNLLYVGNAGTGTLNVNNSAEVSANGSLIVGSAGTGTINISNTAEVNTFGHVTIGDTGSGALHVTSGGLIAAQGDAYIGKSTGSTGAVTVGGANSRWHVLSDWTQPPLAPGGDLSIGHQGNGTLEITDGGRVRSENGKIGAQPGSVGLVRVSGAASAWSIEYSFYETGGGQGIVSGGNLEVGVDGEGTLEVLDDAGLGSWSAYIGANGLVRVDGVGSTWAMSSEGIFSCVPNGPALCVSSETDQFGGYVTVNGELEITNGALVRGAPDVGLNDFNIVSSIGWGSEGRVLVDGAGSKWDGTEPSGAYGYGIDLLVGRVLLDNGQWTSGSGILEITNGGRVDSALSAISWGNVFATATGMVTVDGNGSTWVCEQLFVGGFGTGELAVRNGGYVAVGYLATDIGPGASGTGRVTVEGVGTVFRNAALYVGRDGGSGLLEVIDGGEVTVLGDFVVYSRGEIRGNGNITGSPQNGGLVSPGTSTGALNIDGNYTQTAAGELLIELASAASYDQLLISGDATLGGTLTVNLLDDYIPSVAQSFTILTADEIGFTFDTEVLPTVPNLAFDVIYNTHSVVLTVSGIGVPGDYNHDGTVDAADYVVWRKNQGTQEGYNTWRANFGRSTANGSAAPGSAGDSNLAAPEPSAATLFLALFSAAALLGRPRG